MVWALTTSNVRSDAVSSQPSLPSLALLSSRASWFSVVFVVLRLMRSLRWSALDLVFRLTNASRWRECWQRRAYTPTLFLCRRRFRCRHCCCLNVSSCLGTLCVVDGVFLFLKATKNTDCERMQGKQKCNCECIFASCRWRVHACSILPGLPIF